SVYADLIEVAAAYLFYVCRNHAFIDGNKRTAMMSAILFLRFNGVEPTSDSDDWETLMLDVGASRLDREQTAVRLRKLLNTI
ncbi:MAG TPA: type II toxin-antitoxin system death-on-curing family toxin, partial [Gammaproteobacteria bacterium]|nr:type II toxin-antitoxin system death-on-curing family toxin [Gammaproteobacteria bacterium]